MHIRRRGSERDHGLVGTHLSPRTIAWDPAQSAVEITSWFVNDFNTPARHDWYISVSLPELAAMIDAAASALGGPDSTKVASAFAPSLTSLLRLATESSLHSALNQAKKEPSESRISFTPT